MSKFLQAEIIISLHFVIQEVSLEAGGPFTAYSIWDTQYLIRWVIIFYILVDVQRHS